MIRSILKVSYPNFMTLNKYWKRNTKLSDASIVKTCNERITNNHVMCNYQTLHNVVEKSSSVI